MKHTLHIAIAIAFGLALYTVSQLLISGKVFDVLDEKFSEIITPRNLPRTPPLPPSTNTIQPRPSGTITLQNVE